MCDKRAHIGLCSYNNYMFLPQLLILLMTFVATDSALQCSSIVGVK